jgi:ribose-phosphate pyrophosphokinase
MSITFKGVDFESAPISTGLYSDGTPMVKTDQFEEIAEKATTMTLKAGSLLEFTTAMYLYDALVWNGANLMKLVLPFLPGARQDRTNIEGDVLFTARSVAQDLDIRTFTDIVTLDPHSPVFGQQLGQRKLIEFPLSLVAEKCWQGYSGIIAADKGGRDRAEQFAEAMDKPIFYGGKTRDVSTGKLTGFELEPLLNGPTGPGHYLVVDDICDGGGTFIGLAEEIKKQGGFADLFVSHGIFAKGTRELKNHYKNIYTTDSLVQQREDVDVLTIKVVEEMENYDGRI